MMLRMPLPHEPQPEDFIPEENIKIMALESDGYVSIEALEFMLPNGKRCLRLTWVPKEIKTLWDIIEKHNPDLRVEVEVLTTGATSWSIADTKKGEDLDIEIVFAQEPDAIEAGLHKLIARMESTIRKEKA